MVLAGIASPLIASIAHAQAIYPHTRIRPRERSIAGLIQKGIAESPLLQQLIDRINASDVIVYLVTNRDLPSHVDGQLTFMGEGGGYRYVVVSLAPARSEHRAIAVIGHELQHAVEVAEHPEIVDVPTFARSFQQFGFSGARTWRSRTFDTQAAIDAGDRIWLEVTRRVGTFSEAATIREVGGRR